MADAEDGAPGQKEAYAPTSLWSAPKLAVRGAWFDFWKLVYTYGGGAALFLISYCLLILLLKLAAPEVFRLPPSGTFSEKGLSIGVILLPFTALIQLFIKNLQRPKQ